jgi:hypothetical protein
MRVATADGNSLETRQAGDAVGPLSFGGVAVVGKVTTVAVFDCDSGEL